MKSIGRQVKNISTPILPVHHSAGARGDEETSKKETPPASKASKASWNFGRKSSYCQQKEEKSKVLSSYTVEDGEVETTNKSSDDNYYEGFPLVQAMMATEVSRTAALRKEGSKQIQYPKSNSGWIRSLFVLKGRALDRILLPWTIVTLNAVGWAIAYDKMGFRNKEVDYLSNPTTMRRNYIEGVLELVLTSTMAFLLVFRLNRSATRFWMARGCWGVIVVKCRAMVSSILLHGSHDPYHRDQAIRWIAAFAISTMNLTRDQNIDPKTIQGILEKEELNTLNAADHSPLHAAEQIRFHLSQLFGPVETSELSTVEGDKVNGDWVRSQNVAATIALSDFRAKQLIFLEKQLNTMIDEEGALERIKGTPLPLVYVSHLRTWLMLFLLTLPYFWEASLGYGIIPVECLSAFALLGLEGAASEVEAPFRKDRTNHLDMNSYCLAILSNILQQAKGDARRRITSAKQLNKVYRQSINLLYEVA